MWSSVVFGIGLIIIPIMVFAGHTSDISRGFSIFSAILFWIAAAVALIKANKMRKNLKPVNGKATVNSMHVESVTVLERTEK